MEGDTAVPAVPGVPGVPGAGPPSPPADPPPADPAPADPPAAATACSLAQMPARPLRATLLGLSTDDEDAHARTPSTVNTMSTTTEISWRMR